MVELRPMTKSEYVAYRKTIVEELASALVVSKNANPEESIQVASEEQDELLHDGVATPNQFLFTIIDGDSNAVGMIWFGIMPDFDKSMVFLFFMHIKKQYRRRSFATEAMLQLETKVSEIGRQQIRLHTLKKNHPAIRTYMKCGYKECEVHEHGILFEKDISR